jgi:hypothetical protein
MMKRHTAWMLAASATILSGSAQETVTMKSILVAYGRAIGGQAAWDRIRTQVVTADYEEPGGATGRMVIQRKRPGKELRLLTIDNDGAILRTAVDGKDAWASGPDGVLSPPPTLAAVFAREAVFDRAFKLPELYPSLVLAGRISIAGKDHGILEAKLSEGITERFFFAVDSGLLTRRETVIGPGPDDRLDYYFDAYTESDGIKIPSVIRRVTQSPYTLRVVKVENNVELADDLFRRPPGKP